MSKTTGVTGNTNIPQQQHAAAGSSATSNRIRSFVKNNKVLVGALALVAVYTVITVFVSNDMGLGGLLVTLFLLRYAHKQYEKNSKPTIVSLVGHLITAVIALVIIASPFVQKPLEAVNIANEKLGEVDVQNALEGCPDETGEATVGGTFEIKRGCGTLRLTGNLPRGVTYQVLEGHGDLDFEDNLKNVSRPFPNVRIFEVLDTVPKGTVVKFRIVSAEESAELDRIAVKAATNPAETPMFNVSATR